MADNIQGDNIGRDKFQGDNIARDKHIHNYPPSPDPAFSLQAAQATLASLPTDHVPSPQLLPPNGRMPYSINPKFTGRTAAFKALARTLKGEGGTALITAITGLGGIGKTQLAAEFAHRYGRYFQGGVYWLSFADPEAVPAEIAACGRKMALAGLDTLPLAQQVEKVVGEWESPLPRLLIFDNCEQESLFQQYRPKTGGARLLLTSRRGRWSPGFSLTTLPLNTFTPDESVRLLQQFWPPLTDQHAKAIARALGHLPLALHLAGSYLNFYDGAVTAAHFLAELEKDGPFHEALSGKIEGHTPTEHERNLARTFELSYVQLAPGDLAHQLLLHLTHLAPGEPAPDSLLKATFGQEGDENRPSDKAFMEARQRLVRLGLVTVDKEGGDSAASAGWVLYRPCCRRSGS